MLLIVPVLSSVFAVVSLLFSNWSFRKHTRISVHQTLLLSYTPVLLLAPSVSAPLFSVLDVLPSDNATQVFTSLAHDLEPCEHEDDEYYFSGSDIPRIVGEIFKLSIQTLPALNDTVFADEFGPDIEPVIKPFQLECHSESETDQSCQMKSSSPSLRPVLLPDNLGVAQEIDTELRTAPPSGTKSFQLESSMASSFLTDAPATDFRNLPKATITTSAPTASPSLFQSKRSNPQASAFEKVLKRGLSSSYSGNWFLSTASVFWNIFSSIIYPAMHEAFIATFFPRRRKNQSPSRAAKVVLAIWMVLVMILIAFLCRMLVVTTEQRMLQQFEAARLEHEKMHYWQHEPNRFSGPAKKIGTGSLSLSRVNGSSELQSGRASHTI